MSTDRDDRLKRLHESSFVEGQHTEAEEVSAARAERRAEATKKVVKAVSEVFDLTDEIARDGNPQKKRLAELIEKRILGAVEQAADGEGREALEGAPFSKDSPSLETTSPESSKALPSSPPPKRPRGRPRKHVEP